MSERTLNRLTKADLLVAQPEGRGPHFTDLLYVPGAKEDAQILTPYGQFAHGHAPFRHRYENLSERNQEALYAIHVALIGRRAGILPDSQEGPATLWQKRRHNAKDWEGQAQELSKVLKGCDVFVAATAQYREDYYPLLPGPKAKYYAAPVSEIVTIYDGDKTQLEPVVSTEAGEGLLPRAMWIYQGIYVPTSVQDVELLQELSAGSTA